MNTIPQNAHNAFTRHLVAFAHVLRRAGLSIRASQIQDALYAIECVGVKQRVFVRDALRSIFVSRQEHVALFDQAFDLFWRAPSQTNQVLEQLISTSRFRQPGTPQIKRRVQQALIEAKKQDPRNQPHRKPVLEEVDEIFTYSATEVLQKKDFAQYTAEEVLAAKQLIATMEWPNPKIKTRRRSPDARGDLIDFRRTMQKSLRTQGELIRLFRQEKTTKPRRIIVLCDISGSMDRYSRMLLHFLHSIGAGAHKVESFVFGTRLTRITPHLKMRDIDDAIQKVRETVDDWAGGTRIGEAIKTFNYKWAQRVLRSSAITLIISDGWDRGDIQILKQEISRLCRSCAMVLWLNPLLGYKDYRPLTAGMRAVLPNIDGLLPVHNLESLTQLSDVISQHSRRRKMRESFFG